METVELETIQIELPVAWRDQIKLRTAERGQASIADYIRQLITSDIEPQYLDEETERLIEEGLNSPLEGPIDAAFWAERRRKLDESLKAKAR